MAFEQAFEQDCVELGFFNKTMNTMHSIYHAITKGWFILPVPILWELCHLHPRKCMPAEKGMPMCHIPVKRHWKFTTRTWRISSKRVQYHCVTHFWQISNWGAFWAIAVENISNILIARGTKSHISTVRLVARVFSLKQILKYPHWKRYSGYKSQLQLWS